MTTNIFIYFNVLDSVDTKLEHLNEIDQAEEGDDIAKDYLSKVNQLR